MKMQELEGLSGNGTYCAATVRMDKVINSSWALFWFIVCASFKAVLAIVYSYQPKE